MKTVENVSIVIMFKDPLPNEFSYFRLTAESQNKFDDILGSAEPIPVVPGGDNAPPEVPRYILKDENTEFIFSGISLEFKFLNQNNFDVSKINLWLESIQSILEQFSLPSFRIGVVINGSIADQENFMEDYVNKDNLKSPEEIQLSYRHTTSKENNTLNQWIRYAELKPDNEIKFELDINTAGSISYDKINSFSNLISKNIGDFIE